MIENRRRGGDEVVAVVRKGWNDFILEWRDCKNVGMDGGEESRNE